MSGSFKIGLVVVGYILAFFAAWVTTAIRIAATSGPDAQASSGMYAAGDAMLFVAVFSVCALVPTGAALFFLRPYRRFWVALAAGGVCIAVTGITAVVLFAVGRHAQAATPLAMAGGLSVLRILAAPLLALTFLVCAAFAPRHPARLMLLAATAMEAGVSAYGGFVWFLPMLLARP
jgi:hypothetical protein